MDTTSNLFTPCSAGGNNDILESVNILHGVDCCKPSQMLEVPMPTYLTQNKSHTLTSCHLLSGSFQFVDDWLVPPPTLLQLPHQHMVTAWILHDFLLDPPHHNSPAFSPSLSADTGVKTLSRTSSLMKSFWHRKCTNSLSKSDRAVSSGTVQCSTVMNSSEGGCLLNRGGPCNSCDTGRPVGRCAS